MLSKSSCSFFKVRATIPFKKHDFHAKSTISLEKRSFIWGASRALPLHLIHTYVDRFPRESFWKTCSCVDNGVRGLSACSVISTWVIHTSYASSYIGSWCRQRIIQKLQEALWKVWEDRSMNREARQRRSRERGGRSGKQHQEQQGRSLLWLGSLTFKSQNSSQTYSHLENQAKWETV